MSAPKQLYDAWMFKRDTWKRVPLGAHSDAEEAREYASEHYQDVCQIVPVTGEKS